MHVCEFRVTSNLKSIFVKFCAKNLILNAQNLNKIYIYNMFVVIQNLHNFWIFTMIIVQKNQFKIKCIVVKQNKCQSCKISIIEKQQSSHMTLMISYQRCLYKICFFTISDLALTFLFSQMLINWQNCNITNFWKSKYFCFSITMFASRKDFKRISKCLTMFD